MSCSGSTCSVTLSGSGSRVHLPGGTMSLVQLRDGRATLRGGNRDVVCVEGQDVSVAGLDIGCSAVTAHAVRFTATRR